MLLVALEYDAQGVAHNVQMAYLLRVGGQMLGLTLLMVAVAILVGFIASRVSAAIGRDLRRDVFHTVVGYSNAEIEKFSTASLITRTTNDIQQVQFVCVILLRMVAYAPILGIGGILHVASGNTGLEWIIFVAVAALLVLIVFLMSVSMPVSYTHLSTLSIRRRRRSLEYHCCTLCRCAKAAQAGQSEMCIRDRCCTPATPNITRALCRRATTTTATVKMWP